MPTTTDQQRPQWSRPPPWLMRGVRPNSPIQTTTVFFHRPRSLRSLTRALMPLSRRGPLPVRMVLKMLMLEKLEEQLIRHLNQ